MKKLLKSKIDFSENSSRAGSCKFAHERDLTQLPGVYRFCRNFQNAVCTLPHCRYVHATVFEEQRFYQTGVLPPHALAHHKKPSVLMPPPPPPPPPPPQEEPPVEVPIFAHPPPALMPRFAIMCYKGKCLFCIPVEHGCLVFAVLSAIVTLLALLSCIAIGVLGVAGIIFASESPEVDHAFNDAGIYNRQDRQNFLILGSLSIGFVVLIASIPSLIGFIFSVLLCNGICKRRPGQVKAYFIYGVVITVLAVLASVFQMAVSHEAYPGLMGLAGCVIYGLILWMVFETYLKLSSGTIYKDHHVRLVESY